MLLLSGLNNFYGYLLLKLIYLGLALIILTVFRGLIWTPGKPLKYQILFKYGNILILIGFLILELEWPLWVWLQPNLTIVSALVIADIINLVLLAGYILFFMRQSFLIIKRTRAIATGFGSYLAQYGYTWLFVLNLLIFLRFDYFYLPLVPGNLAWQTQILIEAGVLLFFIVLQLGVLRIRRFKMTEAGPELRGLIAEVAGHFKIRVKIIRIWQLDGVKNAFASGILFKSIFITESLVNIAGPDDLRMILGHECAHLKKRHLITRVAVIFLFVWLGSLLSEALSELNWYLFAVYGLVAVISYKSVARFQEFQADFLAAKLLGGGGLMAGALTRVFGNDSQKFGRVLKWLVGHPELGERVKRLL
jgi:Zn-dependent protease with chaperone function